MLASDLFRIFISSIAALSLIAWRAIFYPVFFSPFYFYALFFQQISLNNPFLGPQRTKVADDGQ
jgi:hypothetical protein